MSFVVEKNEKSVAVVKLDIPKDLFEKGIEAAYNKNKNRFVVDGFRKGKAPRSIVERKYGKQIFYEDAIDEAFPQVYTECVEKENFQTVAAPRLISIDKVGEEGASLTIEISLKPEFEVAEYKGIKVGSLKYTSKKADVEAEIKSLQEKNSRLVSIDSESANDDTVNIDFEGFVGDVAFEGGKGENYPLVLGSGTFIPGFEEQLVGKKAGESLDVTVTFPQEYHSADLAGKEALFKVEIRDVKRKELPEVDDEFAKDLGFDDLAALNKDIKAKLKERKEQELKSAAEQKIVDAVVDATDIDIPQQMIIERSQELKQNYETRLKSSGIDPEMYYSYMLETSENKDPNQFMSMFVQQAERDIKTELVIKKIIEIENIEAAEDELESEYIKYAEAAKQTVEEFKNTLNDYSINYIKGVIAQNKLFDYLLANADTEK